MKGQIMLYFSSKIGKPIPVAPAVHYKRGRNDEGANKIGLKNKAIVGLNSLNPFPQDDSL